MAVDVHERTTAYLIDALLRHLGYDLNEKKVYSIEVLPASVRVTTLAERAGGGLFLGGEDGKGTGVDTHEHPIDWFPF